MKNPELKLACLELALEAKGTATTEQTLELAKQYAAFVLSTPYKAKTTPTAVVTKAPIAKVATKTTLSKKASGK